MALFSELWNAGHHSLANLSRQLAHTFLSIGSPEFGSKMFGPKVLQENHPCGPGLIFGRTLIFQAFSEVAVRQIP